MHKRMVKEVMDAYRFRTKKRFGQNFLTDTAILQEIVHSAALGPEDYCLEIGAGLGVLTKELAQRCRQVLSFEIDRDLVAILAELLVAPNTHLIAGDALERDWLLDLQSVGWRDQPVKMVANLPYYLTSPLLMKALEGPVPFSMIVVMVQREVAERILSVPGTKAYGVLSLVVQYYARCHLVTRVPPNVFVPPPEVESAVIKLTPTPSLVSAPPTKLFSVIRAAFGQRRKTIKNALKTLYDSWGLSEKDFQNVLERVGIPKTARGETLSLAQFGALTEELLRVRPQK